ncbi:MAG: hypothetical protein ABUT20_32190 [Bacteroidota bacterium]
MKKLFLSVALLISLNSLFAQTKPHFVKYFIGDSKMAAYFPSQPNPAEMSWSQDSSKVYTMESELDSFSFYIVSVDMKNSFDSTDAEDILIAYMDYLKSSFKVTEAAGYGKGHTMKNHASAKGIIDYWQDGKNKMSVKGWCDGKNLAIMIVDGPADYPNYNVIEVFQNGFRFPGDK